MLKESLIYRVAGFLFFGFMKIYRSSRAYQLLVVCENALVKAAPGSFFSRPAEGRATLSEIWNQSKSFRGMNKLFTLLADGIGKGMAKSAKLLESSRAISYLDFLSERLHLFTAALLAAVILIPHPYWNNIYSTVASLLLLLLYIYRVARHGVEQFSIRALDFSLVFFIFAVVLGQFTSLFPMMSLKFFVFFITCFIFLFIIVNGIDSFQKLRIFLMVVLGAITLSALYAIYQKGMGIPLDPSLTDATLNEGMTGRAYSTMQNPNNYAELLILTLPFFGAMIQSAGSHWEKFLFTGMMGITLIGLLTTGSRLSWLALGLTVLIYVFLLDWKYIPLVVLLGIIGFLLLPYFSPSVYRRFMTIFNSSDSSINYRSLIYKTVAPMLRDFWHSGVGLGSGVEGAPFTKILNRYSFYHLTQVAASGAPVTTPAHTHNLFLQIWMEMGIIGICTFILLIGRLVHQSLRRLSKAMDVRVRPYIVAGLASLGGILAMGYGEYVWFYPRVLLFFWVLVGLLTVSVRLSGQSAVAVNGEVPQHE